jgi:very-short-patch-repair endonuclease
MPPEVIRARKLRREMSYPEVLLWQRLRGAPEGVRFRRQHPIGADYTADFYCAAARLVIEVDGEIHSHGKAPTRDAVRDEYMRGRGLAVVRLTASEVLRTRMRQPRRYCAWSARPSTTRLAKGRGGPPPQRAGEDL